MTGVRADNSSDAEASTAGMNDADRERARHIYDQSVLSEREAEVYVLKEKGLTHEQIAEELGIGSQSTVGEYSRRIRQKIQRARYTVENLEVP